MPRPYTALAQGPAGPSCTTQLQSMLALPVLPVMQAVLPQARLPLGVTMEGGASNQGFTMGGGPTPDNQGYTVPAPTPTAPPAAPTPSGLPKDLTDWPHKPVAAGAAPPAPAAEVLPKAAMAWDPVQEPGGAAGEARRLEPVAPVGGGNGAGQRGAGGTGGTGHHTPDQARRRPGWLAAACMAACRAALTRSCGMRLPLRSCRSLKFSCLGSARPPTQLQRQSASVKQTMAAVACHPALRWLAVRPEQCARAACRWCSARR